MCAIAGILLATEAGPCQQLSREDRVARVEQMNDSQRHRGPDGSGVFEDCEIALGHRRLSILDLSVAGQQPMTSRDGRWTIAFNGEIFNFFELKRRLDGPFRSATDTEVLLEACAAWGVEKTLAEAAGMFAFALWDRQERELILARDRFGEKPLVYFWDGRTLAFASELKALASFHERRIDPLAADTYFALGYVPAPQTIFRHCRKLPPGHLLQAKRGSEPRLTRWWLPETEIAPAEQVDGTQQNSWPQRITGLRTLVQQTVSQRLRADVPLALSLSGGIDSSVIAAECLNQKVRPAAFTVRFQGDETDLPHARAVAQHLGLSHEVIDADPRRLDLEWEQVLEHLDEPFADSSALACFLLGRALRGRYKVILNGDGGDEIFGGYRHYEYIGLKQWIKRAVASAGIVDGGREVYVQSKSLFRAHNRRILLNGYNSGDGLAQILAESPHNLSAGSALQRALWSDRHLQLANSLTYKMDSALSAYGIEGRAPFLDHRLVAWSSGLPERDFVCCGEKKTLLRAAYAGALPQAILNRPKHGFGAPIVQWMAGPLREHVHQWLPCPLLDPRAQQRQTGQRLWTLLAFAGWARQWKAAW